MSIVRETLRRNDIIVLRDTTKDELGRFSSATGDGLGRLSERRPGDLVNIHGVSLRIPADPLHDVVEHTANGEQHMWRWAGTEYDHYMWHLGWAALWISAQLADSTLSPVHWMPHVNPDEVIA